MGISEAFYIPAALALITDYHTGPHALAGGGPAPDGHLLWRDRGRIRRLCGRRTATGLAVRLRRLRRLGDAVRPAAGAAAAGRAEIGGAATAARTSPPAPRCELLTNGLFILLVLYFTLPALAGWVVRDWMPAILKKQFDIGQGKAGVAATLYWQVAAILGAVVGGWLADRWMRRHERGRIFVSAIGMSLIVPAHLRRGQRRLARQSPSLFLVAVRPGLGLLRLQQHAHPLPDRAAPSAGDRLRHHEFGEHQLRRTGRLGLRRCCATGRCR